MDNSHKDTIAGLLKEIANNDLDFSVSATASSLDDPMLKGYQVTYNPATPKDNGQELIKLLVNKPTNRILIRGLSSAGTISLLPPGRSRPEIYSITEKGGGFVPTFQESDVDVYFDAEDCSSAGYFFLDASGKKVKVTPYIRLFHELVHAKVNIEGNPTHDEDPVITETNQFHKQRGITERAGHEGGCYSSTTSPSVCLIVTAASGSAHAPHVEALLDVRNNLLRTNALGSILERCIYTAYMKFSPLVAGDLFQSAELRQTMLRFFVEPLIDYLLLAQAYVASRGNITTIRRELARLRRRYGQDFGWQTIITHTELVNHWVETFRRGDDENRVDPRIPDDPANLEQVLHYLHAAMNLYTPTNPFLLWAIVEPIHTFWQLMAAKEEAAAGFFVASLHNWLATIPIPGEVKQVTAATMRQGLSDLAETFLMDEALRAQLAARLLAQMEAESTYDLRAMLYQAGYSIAEGVS